MSSLLCQYRYVTINKIIYTQHFIKVIKNATCFGHVKQPSSRFVFLKFVKKVAIGIWFPSLHTSEIRSMIMVVVHNRNMYVFYLLIKVLFIDIDFQIYCQTSFKLAYESVCIVNGYSLHNWRLILERCRNWSRYETISDRHFFSDFTLTSPLVRVTVRDD